MNLNWIKLTLIKLTCLLVPLPRDLKAQHSYIAVLPAAGKSSPVIDRVEWMTISKPETELSGSLAGKRKNATRSS